VEWTSDLTAQLIMVYETHPCLFDPKHKFYSNKHARADALGKIVVDLKTFNPKVEVEDVKKKWNNLRSQFSHEHHKVLASERSGMGTEDLYEPSVWWYEKLQFLLPHIRARKSTSSLSSQDIDCSSNSQDYTQDLPFDAYDRQLCVAEDHSESSCTIEDTTPSTSHMVEDGPRRAKQRRLDQQSKTAEDPVLGKAVAALDVLGQRINQTSTVAAVKTDVQVYAEYVANELRDIGDQELLNDAKHGINTILYQTKKQWFESQRKKCNDS
jgi:hypothetical protein